MGFGFSIFDRQTWPGIGAFTPQTNQTMGSQSDAQPKVDLPLQTQKSSPRHHRVVEAASTAATLALARIAQINAPEFSFPLAPVLSWAVPIALGAAGCYLAYKVWQQMGVTNQNTTKVEVHVHITSQNPPTVVVKENGPIVSNVMHSGG